MFIHNHRHPALHSGQCMIRMVNNNGLNFNLAHIAWLKIANTGDRHPLAGISDYFDVFSVKSPHIHSYASKIAVATPARTIAVVTNYDFHQTLGKMAP